MAFLTSCWFIIENVIIPDGFQKWFYLSFFIHPLILVFCQIFLWLKLLKHCLVVVLAFPLRTFCVICLYIFGVCKKFVIFVFSFTRFYKGEVEEEAEQYFDAQPRFSSNRIADSFTQSLAAPVRCKTQLLEAEEDVFEEAVGFAEDSLLSEDQNLEGSLYLLCSSNSFATNENSNGFPLQIQTDFAQDSILYGNLEEPMFCPGEDTHKNEYFLCGSNSFTADEYPKFQILPLSSSNSDDRDLYTNEYSPTAPYACDFQIVEREESAESDGFYKMYNERMSWFDVLNYDRTCGISAIEEKQLGTPSPFETETGVVLHLPWSKTTKRRLLRSVESDFEMVYVAQSCLSWEALHHQYRKVKEIEFCSSENNIFCSNVFAEFQKFQVLLERFMENEHSEGRRVLNFVQGRFTFKSLLQVPEFSVKGLMEENKEEMKGQGTNVKGVLRAIEECIEAFWLFVKTDEMSKKSWWKITSSWALPPVEDPRDLELLADLTKRLQKNKLWLKDLQGKKRCLLKRIVNHDMEESERQEMLFTMIDMKLVSRVLQMAMISSSQLKWCQEKLDNIEFKHGKLVRASTYPLFPP
ncbi:hypothetical protein TIFTF001_011451 [Ficus carica]|uniref:Ribosomal protein L34Ae n=1 Tax=Ficus carica TaxID=3494 RepID=A0AA87ZYP2_FICCA|nr:hypothetical protein TIFTF001_011451 [Ficus carica]